MTDLVSREERERIAWAADDESMSTPSGRTIRRLLRTLDAQDTELSAALADRDDAEWRRQSADMSSDIMATRCMELEAEVERMKPIVDSIIALIDLDGFALENIQAAMDAAMKYREAGA